MRLKHVKGAEEKVQSSPYVITDPFSYKGKMQTLFREKKPLYLEIGMGKGNFIYENAKRNPNIHYIGIEKYESVIVRAIEKLEREEIPNLKLICIDASKIEDIFDHEIDVLYLNFSDPWPKERHQKRRLTSLNFLKHYDHIFKKSKRIILKTDNRKFFEFSVKSFIDYDYKIEDICLDLYSEDITTNIPTEYEKKFHDKGFPIYKIEVLKK